MSRLGMRWELGMRECGRPLGDTDGIVRGEVNVLD
jgi:hypothetical protein